MKIVKCEKCNGKGHTLYYFAPEVSPAKRECEPCNGTGVKLVKK